MNCSASLNTDEAWETENMAQLKMYLRQSRDSSLWKCSLRGWGALAYLFSISLVSGLVTASPIWSLDPWQSVVQTLTLSPLSYCVNYVYKRGKWKLLNCVLYIQKVFLCNFFEILHSEWLYQIEFFLINCMINFGLVFWLVDLLGRQESKLSHPFVLSEENTEKCLKPTIIINNKFFKLLNLAMPSGPAPFFFLHFLFVKDRKRNLPL